MNLSSWGIRNPAPVVLLFIILTVAGVIAFRDLGVQDRPDVDLPMVVVTASMPGMSPGQLETEVTRPIEDSVANIGMIDHIISTVVDGVSATTIQFGLDKDLQAAVDDVRESISRIRSTLPDDLQEPLVSKVTTTGTALYTYGIASDDMDEADLSWFVDDTLAKALLPVEGVGRVERQGGVTREVQVNLDPLRLKALNVTAGEISERLRSVQQEAPSGRVGIGGQDQAVRTVGTVSTADQLERLVLPLTDGRRLRLDEIATVRDTVADRRQLAFLDGKPIIGFQVFRARGFDEVSVGKGIRNAIESIRQEYPYVHVEEINNSVHLVEASYRISMNTLYEGTLLAVLVVWLFLRDWRATILSAVALPLSIIPTFAAMSLLGFTLNIVTLLALTLVIGVLVDDAIVEVENIMRHLRFGKAPRQASLDAANEIGLAVVATSLTLVAVFLPTAFMGGIPGLFFKQFGWTAAIAVLCSLLVARLLLPMLAAHTLRPEPGEHRMEGKLMRRYLRAVRHCLAHPGYTCLGVAIFFTTSLALILVLPKTFIGGGDASTLTVTLRSPPGGSLEQSAQLARHAESVLRSVPEIQHVYAVVDAQTNTAVLSARLKDSSERERSKQEIEAPLRARLQDIPGARIALGSGVAGEKLSIVLAGEDPVLLRASALALDRDLRTIPGLGNVDSSVNLQRPEIVIRPDFVRAAELGVTAAAIGRTVRVATVGDYDFNLPKLQLPERQIYIRVQQDPDTRSDHDLIARLEIAGLKGPVTLGTIADIRLAGGPVQIDRFDRKRNVVVSVELGGRSLGDVLEEIGQLPAMRQLPPGVEMLSSGEAERMGELFGGFLLAMVAGVFCVYAVMVLLFHDFGQPITVLVALPLAAGGAFGLLVLLGLDLSVATLIGLLMLIGIVTKNSILLVEYVIMARRDLKLDRTEALIDACRKRARPIVMTTVAMVAGMLPLALGVGDESGLRVPMAVVVIGGLLTSTLLSLLVVPVFFELIDDAKKRLRISVFGPAPQPN